jgi:hypothetical protein
MGDYGDALWHGIVALMIVSFLAGSFLMWLLPIAWSWLKPIVHSLTG